MVVAASKATSKSAVLDEQWSRVASRLRQDYGDSVFRQWIAPLRPVGLSEGEVSLAAGSAFKGDWIRRNYGDAIAKLWAAEDAGVTSVRIVEGKPMAAVAAVAAPAVASSANDEPARPALAPVPAQPMGFIDFDDGDLPSSKLDERFNFDNFVVGKPNELAYAAAKRVAEAQGVTFNPLYFYGGVGLGKTHLMHAIAWHIRRTNPQRRVLFLTAETFMFQFVKAIRQGTTVSFKERFRSVDVLMVDDIQFISSKEQTQEEFFHTFNALVDNNRQVVVSADKSPTDLEGIGERLRSRLGWGLMADINPTTFELRLGILQAKAELAQVAIEPKVLEFIAHKITSNVRELEGALTRLVAHAQLVGRAITLETTRDVLADVLRANDRRVTIDEIQRKVAAHFNMKMADMESARRARAVARPRQVAMYLAKQLTSRSLPEIGKKFGGRDHTTVIHAVKKVEELRATDPGFAEEVELLRRMLES